MSVDRGLRHTRARRCPVCGGADGDPRGQGKRCSGFTSADGEWCHCSREEHAGGLSIDGAGTYAHRMAGDCKCGKRHGPARERSQNREPEIAYDYRDESGELLFQVVRLAGKKFLQRRPDGHGGWIWKLGATRRVPYRLPELVASDPARAVYIVEGEKDADNLATRGQLATCNPGGAGKWHQVAEAAAVALADRDVVVVADADKPGRAHAHQVAALVFPVAKSVRVLELPQKDASDFFAAGGTVGDIERLRASIEPWRPGAQSHAPEEPAAPEEPLADPTWHERLLRDREGKPRRTVTNIVEALLHHPGWDGVLRYNEFAQSIETVKSPPWHAERIDPGEWTEADDVRLVMWCERELGPSFTGGGVRSAAENVARRRSYHPVREHLRGLKWDGIVRLPGWLAYYLGATTQPADYLAHVGTWWMISAVARIMVPGCQADHLLVLEGPQGTGKSTAVKLLGDPWSSSMTATLGEKDSYQALRNKWVIELAELAGMRRSDAERVKAFVSARIDSYRPSYARTCQDFARQCVFIGTTNTPQYIGDGTGGRRFWPVRVYGKARLADLARDIPMLWAEALVRYDQSEAWWPSLADIETVTEQQEERTEIDPWESVIEAYIASKIVKGEVEMAELLGVAIGKTKEDWTRADETRVGAIMHRLKWRRTRPSRGGKRIYLYVRDTGEETAGAANDTMSEAAQ